MANGRVVGATVAAMLLAVASRAPAMPADFVYKVVMDTDNNPATGCSFVVQDANIPSQSMNGFEHALEIFVATAFTPPKVVGMQLLHCVSGSTFALTATLDANTWPIGVNNGVAVPSAPNADVVEGYVSRAAVGDPSTMRIIIIAETAADATDVLLTSTGAAPGDAPPLLLSFPAASAPAMSAVGLGILAVMLAGLPGVYLRRRCRTEATAVLASIAVAATAWAATIVMDGQVADWTGVPRLGTDMLGDSSISHDAEDIVTAFATRDPSNLYFRIDIKNIAFCGDGVMDPGEACELGIPCNPSPGCTACQCDPA